MDDAEFTRLKDAISNARPAFDIETFSYRVAGVNKDLDTDEIADLVAAITPVMSGTTEQDDIDTFAEAVSISIREDEKLDVSKAQANDLENRLLQLFAIEDTLGTVAKARAIYFFDGNDFCDVKIVTDVRPIFKSDADQEPTAAVLVHAMQFGYHRNRNPEHKEFTLTLDEDELDVLQEAIDRARAKAKTLVRMIEKAGMRCLKPDPSENDGD